MYKILDQVLTIYAFITNYYACKIIAGLPVNETFTNVMIDIGSCSGDCQGRCLPAKTKREVVHLYSGPREVEIIDTCKCLLSDGSTCATVKKEVTYFQGTSCQATVNVNQCAGSCGGTYVLSGCI